MVQVITGAGLGVERTSALLLGAGGTLGTAAQGQAGENVTVNAETGNLIVSNTDQMLIGTGLNATINSTYNSLGLLDGGNTNNGWQIQGAQVLNLTGTLDTVGSTIQRLGWDGSIVTYTWNAGFTNADGSTGAYTAKESSGADDSLTFDSLGSAWTWHEGSTGITELYDQLTDGGPYQVVSRTDRDDNSLTYSYTGNLITQVTTADGEYISLVYSSSNLSELVTHTADGSSLTRTYYSYDDDNRLTQVTVDLSPDDNSIADGNVYTTGYAYVGSSSLISSITQTDGSQVSFTYDDDDRITSWTQQLSSGVSQTTELTYETGATEVTDAQGNVTTLAYDSDGNLTQITAPPAVSGGDAQITAFTYDTSGNLLSAMVFDGAANQTTDDPISGTNYSYDTQGNVLTKTDLLGNTTSYVYNAANEIVAQTQYGSIEGGTDGAAETSYNTYDTNGNLRFTVSPEGRVTEYRYNSSGQVISTLIYTSDGFSTSAYSPSDLPEESDLESWVSSLADMSTVERSDTSYDFRGNISSMTTYTSDDSSGNGRTWSSEYSQINYTYDQSGNLLSRIVNGQSQGESYVYDGLGRVISSVDLNDATTTVNFEDSLDQTVTTYANGLVETRVYDLAGDLVSVTRSDASIPTATTSYAYDSLGRLTSTTDPDGGVTSYIYDDEGRKVATVDPTGALTLFRYDAADRMIGETSYATLLSSEQRSDLSLSTLQSTASDIASSADRSSWNVYDAAGQLIETIDPAGAATVYAYDEAGQEVSSAQYATLLPSGELADFLTDPPTSLVTVDCR